MTRRTTCAVIGGGPAGMVAGLLLARAGIEVTVLEKHGDFLRDFRGDTVHPSTLDLLDELGLGERFAALPQSKVEGVAFPIDDENQLVFADLTRLKNARPYIAMVPQWDFLNLLADAGAEEPAFTLEMNAEVTELIREGDAVRGVRFRRTDGSVEELRADLTIAADGRWSLARRQANLTPHEFPVPIDAWWFRLPRHPGETTGFLAPRMGNGHFAVVIPREGYYQIAYIAPKGSDPMMRAAGVERFRDRIADAAPLFADRVDAIESMDDVKHLDVRLNRLHRWHTEGLLCVGDAAHAMSPIGGVGINLAVQDAVAAAHLLAGPLKRGRVTTADLAKVRKRRWLPTVLVQTLQRILHRQVIKPVLDGRRDGPPKPMVKLVETVPLASYLPARLIGVGFRPEHAPEFARRSPAATR
ncbi:FAD-dependent oxidoreductase [Amycolatopsis suaedae]|uniref:FAD-dependent oxidoreductase n=1 Tax=Amycolatopsis suaedae TaxID=2510978 RepID=A0A4Q7JDU4_9PSEU|nr:FAD-dependent oxidoreductase [Amycolatopsis suaedae]RZQ64544.1 FAD-dependent oxidoreductase [Amycolatopsis suaedae]